MYTLLLVDDEPLELETLRDYVPWQDVDVTRVLTACDGQEALRQCAQNHVDIVLTDIKMPVMDGLSFARALPEAGCAAKVIFLSGYDDFSYVNGAYLAGGVEYILKPFVKDEVLRVVRAAQMQIVDSRKRDAAQRLYIGEQLGRWMTARDENALIALRAAQIASCALALIQTDAPRSILRQCMEAVSRYCFDVDIERGVLLAIQDAKRMHNILLRVRDELNMQEQNCGVVYFTVPAALEEMPKAYAALVQGASELFYAEKEGLLNIDGAALQAFGEQVPEGENEIAACLSGRREERLPALLEDYLKRARMAHVRPDVLRGNCAELAMRMLLNVKGEMRDDVRRMAQCIPKAASFDALREQMLAIADRLTGEQQADTGDRNSRLIAQVTEAIERDYAKPLTADGLAESVYLSPNYLRTLFKEKTGKTVLDYITQCRMNAAAKLLADGKHKVKEISHMVGYDSESYFCSCFYKTFDMTPKQYRNRYSGGRGV